VDDAGLVEVEDGVGQLPEDQGGFVLVEEFVLAGVFEEVAFREQFGDDVEVGFGLVVCDEFDDVGVVDLFQDAALSFQYFALVGLETEGFDHFDGHQFACQFVLPAEDVREVTASDALQFEVLVEDGALAEVGQLLQPFFPQSCGWEGVNFVGVESVPVF
jgi:hypothetical protein